VNRKLTIVAAMLFEACSSDDPSPGISTPDASTESAAPAPQPPPPPPNPPPPPPVDAGACPKGKSIPDAGETCTGFGKGDPCTPECGLYGYVCVNGGPPGFTGCLQMSGGSFGETYCCPKNDCVAEPDQDSHCSGAGGKPHLFQCPPNGDGGFVAPAAGCATTTPLGPYDYYCCP
jgi:hypothetical protein